MQDETVNIPYFVHEGEMTRLERANKRWFISFMVVLAMLFLTNIGWIVYESQFAMEEYKYEVTQDNTDGVNTYTGNRVIVGGDDNGETDN